MYNIITAFSLIIKTVLIFMLIYLACGNRIFVVIFARKEIFYMLNENIKIGRKSKGLSQDELAIKLNVVRQTVSK